MKFGFRHIDTAHSYGVERGVGQGIRESGIPREEIWLTSKLYPFAMGEGKTMEAIEKMLARLGTDYVDLLYVHHPFGDFRGGWKDMEKAVKMGKVRALGISNFDYPEAQADFEYMCDSTEIHPQIMQIECNPYYQQTEIRQKAADKGIRIECWFPLGGSMNIKNITSDPVIGQIAKAHGKSPVQIILRWEIQEGLSTIPGSKNPVHIQEDINIFDFELTPEEMQQMRALDKNKASFPHNYQIMKGRQENRVLPD